jgi:hypothetical protein
MLLHAPRAAGNKLHVALFAQQNAATSFYRRLERMSYEH